MSTKYTREIADEICQRLAGGKSLTAICNDEVMPSYCAVRNWIRKDIDGFAARHAQAVDAAHERLLKIIAGDVHV